MSPPDGVVVNCDSFFFPRNSIHSLKNETRRIKKIRVWRSETRHFPRTDSDNLRVWLATLPLDGREGAWRRWKAVKLRFPLIGMLTKRLFLAHLLTFTFKSGRFGVEEINNREIVYVGESWKIAAIGENLHKSSITAAWSDKKEICKEKENGNWIRPWPWTLDNCVERENRCRKNTCDEHDDYDLENSTSNQVQTGLLFTPVEEETPLFSTIKFEYDQLGETLVASRWERDVEQQLGNKGRVTNQQSSSFRFTSSRMTTGKKRRKLDNFVATEKQKKMAAHHPLVAGESADPTAWEQQTFDSARINDEFPSSHEYFWEWSRGNMKIVGFSEKLRMASSQSVRNRIEHGRSTDAAGWVAAESICMKIEWICDRFRWVMSDFQR